MILKIYISTFQVPLFPFLPFPVTQGNHHPRVWEVRGKVLRKILVCHRVGNIHGNLAKGGTKTELFQQVIKLPATHLILVNW